MVIVTGAACGVFQTLQSLQQVNRIQPRGDACHGIHIGRAIGV
jgi:hypothetical protein